MRGASVLGEKLAMAPAAGVRVLVVWEPVIASDTGPPTADVRAPLDDPRVSEWWDDSRWLSDRVLARARLSAEAAGLPPPDPSDDGVAWDLVAYYPAGARWQDPFPQPVSYGVPVVSSLAVIDQALTAGTPRGR